MLEGKKPPFATFRLDNELILTTLSLARRVFMSDTNNLKVTYGLDMKLSTKDEQLATIRERQKRLRKEELYSYPTKSRKTNS
jgi:hypothetical protein